ncbi:MAG: hypothetical protein U0441_10060 [Polyangiaceae bacterium]
MAALLGYSGVPNTGFVSFLRALEEGPWGAVSTKAWDSKKKDSDSSLLDAPLIVAFKLELRTAVLQLVDALGTPNLLALDEDWDSTQRRLSFRIAEARNAKDRAARAAADRVSSALLVNGGVAQTQLDLDGEVDFGWTQLHLVKNDPRVAADVKSLKMQDVIDDVEKSTNALAEALGRNKGKKRKSRSLKLKEALQGCVTAFNTVHQGLLLLLNTTPKGAAHDRISALVEPLEELLSRASSAASADNADIINSPEELAPSPGTSTESKPS